MKKLTICLCSLAFGFTMAGVAGATSVGFNLAGASDSSLQTLTGTVGSANLASPLEGNLGNQIFYLSDAQTKIIDMSGGTLKWDPKTLPDVFTVAGDSFTANFQDGSAISGVNGWRIMQWFPKLSWHRHPLPPYPPPNLDGGGTAPVPEPGTILLLGSGIMGLVLYGRRRMKG